MSCRSRSLLLAAVVLCLTPNSIAPPTLQNITISVPLGTSNHGDQGLLCTPQRASAVAVFFLANYLAHVVTVKSVPGQPLILSILDLALALFFPAYGVGRGLSSIVDGAIQGKTPLETALRSGALCEVVRTRFWQPSSGDRVQNLDFVKEPASGDRSKAKLTSDDGAEIDSVNLERLEHNKSSNNGKQEHPPILLEVSEPSQTFGSDSPLFQPAKSLFSPTGRKVHGYCRLPVGYALSIVPKSTAVHPLLDMMSSPDDAPQHPATVDFSSNSNLSKSLVAILQLTYATYTLNKSKGDQIDRFGYAAFGLTVTPYLIMSFINLLSSLLTPDYSHVYLVTSEIMKEAENHGGQFHGCVGTLEEATLGSFAAEFVEETPGEHPLHHTHSNLEETNSSNDGVLFMMGISDHDKTAMRNRFDSRHNSLYSFSCPFAHKPEFKRRRSAAPWHIRVPSGWMPPTSPQKTSSLLYGSFIIGSLSIAVVGGLSGFHHGDKSTQAQRAWTMAWLATGIFIGPTSYFIQPDPLNFLFWSWAYVFQRLSMLVYAVPAIGGFVTVSQMIWDYGDYKRLY